MRLPSEVEWEAAARGLQGRHYPCGDSFDATAASLDSGARVGTHARGNTPEGVADLIGSVWEWTSSSFEPYPGGKAIAGSEGKCVIRGGAFNTQVTSATAYYRVGMLATASRANISQTGFRCAASLPAAGAAR